MHYAEVVPFEVCNGTGIGTSFFVQGCDLQCKNCFNKTAWDFNGGKEWDDKKKNKFFDVVSRYYIKRVSFLGGEPLSFVNAGDVGKLIKEVKTKFPYKKIWVFSGYKMEELMKRDTVVDILNSVDVVVDGRFIEGLKDARLKFRGSSNQRIWYNKDGQWIDVTNSVG